MFTCLLRDRWLKNPDIHLMVFSISTLHIVFTHENQHLTDSNPRHKTHKKIQRSLIQVMLFGLQRGITGKLQVNHNAEMEPGESVTISKVRDWVTL